MNEQLSQEHEMVSLASYQLPSERGKGPYNQYCFFGRKDRNCDPSNKYYYIYVCFMNGFASSSYLARGGRDGRINNVYGRERTEMFFNLNIFYILLFSPLIMVFVLSIFL